MKLLHHNRKNEKEKAIIQYLSQHGKRLFCYAQYLTRNRADAEDLYQETIYRSLNHLQSYVDCGMTDVWLCRIMKNTYLNEVNRAYNRSVVHVDHIVGLEVDHDTPESIYTIDELYNAIGKLPRNEQDIITLYIQGYSYAEIAEMKNMKLGTVKSSINRIKRHLKILLTDI